MKNPPPITIFQKPFSKLLRVFSVLCSLMVPQAAHTMEESKGGDWEDEALVHIVRPRNRVVLVEQEHGLLTGQQLRATEARFNFPYVARATRAVIEGTFAPNFYALVRRDGRPLNAFIMETYHPAGRAFLPSYLNEELDKLLENLNLRLYSELGKEGRFSFKTLNFTSMNEELSALNAIFQTRMLDVATTSIDDIYTFVDNVYLKDDPNIFGFTPAVIDAWKTAGAIKNPKERFLATLSFFKTHKATPFVKRIVDVLQLQLPGLYVCAALVQDGGLMEALDAESIDYVKKLLSVHDDLELMNTSNSLEISNLNPASLHVLKSFFENHESHVHQSLDNEICKIAHHKVKHTALDNAELRKASRAHDMKLYLDHLNIYTLADAPESLAHLISFAKIRANYPYTLEAHPRDAHHYKTIDPHMLPYLQGRPSARYDNPSMLLRNRHWWSAHIQPELAARLDGGDLSKPALFIYGAAHSHGSMGVLDQIRSVYRAEIQLLKLTRHGFVPAKPWMQLRVRSDIPMDLA